uniref:Uncharacterized protein n=1 Tax=Branchiostoma floridae TaxID=7739 RepID=C3XS69_BRAFL|eukprot:XP_002613075.1 hypothetical protein BRAFLDRAFT_89957 [Branchiostoma floridae]
MKDGHDSDSFLLTPSTPEKDGDTRRRCNSLGSTSSIITFLRRTREKTTKRPRTPSSPSESTPSLPAKRRTGDTEGPEHGHSTYPEDDTQGTVDDNDHPSRDADVDAIT